jgi:hypothetical protein
LTFCPTILDRDVLTLEVASFTKTLPERTQEKAATLRKVNIAGAPRNLQQPQQRQKLQQTIVDHERTLGHRKKLPARKSELAHLAARKLKICLIPKLADPDSRCRSSSCLPCR